MPIFLNKDLRTLAPSPALADYHRAGKHIKWMELMHAPIGISRQPRC